MTSATAAMSAPAEVAIPRQFRATVAFAVLVMIANVTVHWLLRRDPFWHPLATDSLAVAAAICAGVALLFAQRKSTAVSPSSARAWGFMALATFIYAIGEGIDLYQSQTGQDVFGTASDFFFLLFYPLFILGLFLLPSRRLERGETARLLLEIGIVMVASAQLFWIFFFAPSLSSLTSESTWFELFLTLAYPALDLAMLWVVATLFLRQPHTTQQGPLLLLAMFVLAMSIGDALYNWFEMVNGDSHNPLAMTAFIVSWMAALLAGGLHGHSARAETQPTAAKEPIRMALVSANIASRQRLAFYVPYLSVLISFSVLVFSLFRQSDGVLDLDLAIEIGGMGVIVILVLVRQVVAFRENAVLSLKLARLLEASRILASPLELRPLLRLTLNELKHVVDFHQATLLLTQTKGEGLLALTYDQLNHANIRPATICLTPHLETVINTGNTVILHSISLERACAITSGTLPDLPSSKTQGDEMAVSWMGVPLRSRDQVIGLLTICYHWPNYYTNQDASAALTFANQTAAAIDNARLRSSERVAAVSAERSRLARELHDSVSQALFGISLGAKTARELLKDDTVRAGESMDYVIKLTAGALAEMRALIFELRPESLATEGLAAALKRQIHVLTARHNLEAQIEMLGNDRDISLDTQEGLYRIALEAVQNTIKHANATQATIRLLCESDPVIIEVQDNGRGFNTNGEFPGHLGLISMRERAEFFNGSLEIQSAQGKGTTVRALIPRNTHIIEPLTDM